MSENLAEQVIRPSYAQTVGSITQIGSASGAAERVEVERLNSPEVGGL